jgi:hypothetical protein
VRLLLYLGGECTDIRIDHLFAPRRNELGPVGVRHYPGNLKECKFTILLFGSLLATMVRNGS